VQKDGVGFGFVESSPGLVGDLEGGEGFGVGKRERTVVVVDLIGGRGGLLGDRREEGAGRRREQR